MQIVERKERSIIIDGIVDSDIRSRNFAGSEKRHRITGQVVNGQGRRNFLLYHLPEDVVADLQARGCDVKFSKVQNPNDIPAPYVSISVSYYLKPVETTINRGGVMTALTEQDIKYLDSLDISRMCIGLDFGKPKTRTNGVVYTPIWASTIYAEIAPNYFLETFGGVASPAAPVTDEADENDPF